jgi:hypothetical protein
LKMPVRAADLQTVFSQTPNVERVQHFALQQGRAQAEMLGAQFAQEVVRRQQRVDENQRADQNQVTNDRRRQGRPPSLRIIPRRHSEELAEPVEHPAGIGKLIDVRG